MNRTDTAHLVILDDAWRPHHRMGLTHDWRHILMQLLHHDSRWIALHQQRAEGQDISPLPVDIRLTRALCRRLRPLDMMLTDHVIDAGKNRFSFRAAGLL